MMRLPQWLAAAAAIALGVWLGSIWFSAKRSVLVAREDINHDGRVDILDAFALARRVQKGGTADPLLDINSDGFVDQKDIDALAAQAVKLEKGRG